MAETQRQTRQTTAAMAEQLLEVGLLALKGFIFMLWVRGMASPFQFLIGGLLILLAAYLLNLYSGQQQTNAARGSTSPTLSTARKTVRFHDHPAEETLSEKAKSSGTRPNEGSTISKENDNPPSKTAIHSTPNV
ncbi:hypothetical protein B0T16DRAFT_456424 [Cercophora newfieldiana]|uniref:Uncharacterized protein n=1 Tax=Cercophora newfieldiana TaxID=92897 RepID=A0AA39YCJ7_9PEZI|nr:hypothetical protein B0T16DRAFT_456424 [Cercophora newfieldiana]